MAIRFRCALAAALLAVACGSSRVQAQSSGGEGATPDYAVTQSLQQSLLQDPGTRDRIFSLQDDPLVQSILRDDALLRAVQNGDLDRLMKDPRLRELARHPTVQGIIQQQQGR